MPSRGPGRRWISCANSENRSGLARWAVLGPEVSIQTSRACQEDRPLCSTCLHLASIASAVAGHVCPTRLQRLLSRSIEGSGEHPDGTGLLASLETSSPLGPDDFRLLVSCPASSRRRPPPPAIRQVISIGVVIDAHLPSGLAAIVRRGTCSCQDCFEDLRGVDTVASRLRGYFAGLRRRSRARRDSNPQPSDP